MNIRLFALLAFSISLSACSIFESGDDNNYLVFGHFYGFCGGADCNIVFKLDNENLFRATDPSYPGEVAIDYKFEKQSKAQYQKAKDLIDLLPEELLSEADGTIGCPDCHDQGGLIIEYYDGEDLRRWRLDQSKNGLPKYLHPFSDAVNARIKTLTTP